MQERILGNFIIYIQNNRSSIAWKTILAISVFIVWYRIIKIITTKIKEKIEENNLQSDAYTHNTSELVAKFVGILLMVFLVLAVFQVIGFDTAIIMWWISLSLWFAMETTIGNMISWIMILTNKKIKLGDFVEFMGKIKMRWTIEEINIRYTVVRTRDKKRTIIPNSIIAKTPIQTIKSEPLLRGEVLFTVPRHVSISQIKNIIITTINAHPQVLYHEYTNMRVENFDTRGIQIKWVFFTDPKKKVPFLIARDLRPQIAINLKKYGINIPYPHITLSTEN